MEPKAPATVLTLLRHGQSTYNLQGLYQGSCDLPTLTKEGREQALQTAARLETSYDALWCSPLQRAKQTADLLRHQRADLPALEIVEDLSEIALPEWQGRPFKEVQASEPSAHHCWKFTPSQFVMPDESGAAFSPAEDVFRRADAILSKLRALPQGQSVLAVTHGGMIRALLARALNMPMDYLHAAVVDNCSLTQIAVSDSGTTQLMSFNRGASAVELRLERSLQKNMPILAVGTAGSRLTLQKLMNGQFDQISTPKSLPDLGTNSGPEVAELDPEKQRDLLQSILGLPDESAIRLPLRQGCIQAVTKRTSTNPAALWLLNEVVPGLHHQGSSHTIDVENCK